MEAQSLAILGWLPALAIVVHLFTVQVLDHSPIEYVFLLLTNPDPFLISLKMN